jgi:hypothetical protein
MRTRRHERGSALLMSVIIVLVATVIAVGVIRFGSRELAASFASRKEASVTACADAARAYIMGQWKLLATSGGTIKPVDLVLDSRAQTTLQGGHYDQTPTDSKYWDATSGRWISNMNVQIHLLMPTTVGPAYKANDLTNRIGTGVLPYRIVAHCTQADGRQVEVESAVNFGL